jgi:hypothetical protein
MPKWIVYCLAALGDLILAVIAYMNDRIVFTAILGFAGLLFLAAAAGSLKQQKRGAN